MPSKCNKLSIECKLTVQFLARAVQPGPRLKAAAARVIRGIRPDRMYGTHVKQVSLLAPPPTTPLHQPTVQVQRQPARRSLSNPKKSILSDRFHRKTVC